jgi:hypothetical protein
MGSPLAPVITNCYMKLFEQQVVSSAAKKLEHRYECVDDIFCHLDTERMSFKVCSDISAVSSITMEVEQNEALSFLEALMSRRPDNLPGHTVYIYI